MVICDLLAASFVLRSRSEHEGEHNSGSLRKQPVLDMRTKRTVRHAWRDFEILNDLTDPYFVMDLTPLKSCIHWANDSATRIVQMSLADVRQIDLNKGNSSATQREFSSIYQDVQVNMQAVSSVCALYPAGREFRFLWKCTPTNVLLPGEKATRVLALISWVPPSSAAEDVNSDSKTLPLRACAEILRHLPSWTTMFDMEQQGFPSIFTCVQSQTFYDTRANKSKSQADFESAGKSPRSICLQHVLQSCEWEDVQGSEEVIRRIHSLKIGDPEIGFVCRKRTPGKPVSSTWHKVLFIPVLNPLSSIAKRATLVIEFDITEEVLVRADLSLAERAQGSLEDFVGAVSHELRTPLNGIMGLSDSLLSICQVSKMQEVSKMQDMLLMIKQCGNRLKEMVDNIIDVSSIGRGELALTWKLVDLSDVSQRVCFQLRELGRVASPHVTLVNTVTKACPLLAGDERRIQQVLYNLVSNALKFTTHGFVSVSAGQKGDQIVLAVEDSGRGVPEGRREDIWKPWTQADMSVTRQHGGAGLGLSIVKEVVEAHQGAVSLHSRADGERTGSCFRCSFPLRSSDMGHRRTPSESVCADEAGAGAGAVVRGRNMSEISRCDTAEHWQVRASRCSSFSGSNNLQDEAGSASGLSLTATAKYADGDWLGDCFGAGAGPEVTCPGSVLRESVPALPGDAISMLDPCFYLSP